MKKIFKEAMGEAKKEVLNAPYLQKLNEELREENETLKRQINALLSVPEGCKVGGWCRGCAFEIRLPSHCHEYITGCGFGVCGNYTPKPNIFKNS